MKKSIVWILSMYWLSAAADECEECQGEAPQTKAGVAMLVKTHHAKHVSGIESTEGIEREATLIRKVLTSPTAELSQSMVEELAAMRITPEVAAFIKGTLTNLEAVFVDIEEASTADSKAREAFLDSFDELLVNITADNKTAQTIGRGVVEARDKHTECRNQEKAALDAKRTCDDELAVLFTAKENAFTDLETQTKSLKALICHSEVTANLKQKVDKADPYAEAGRKYIDAADAYDKKKVECDKKTQIHTDKRAKCKEKQGTLEQCVCMEGRHALDSCAAYTAAYNVKVADYKEYLKTLADNVVKRKFEWKHLKRVHCTLGALANHTVEKHSTITDTIKGCQSKPFLNPKLDIELTPAPDTVHCLPVPDMPCVQAYKSKEYSNLPEGCPAHECQPCI